MKTSTLLGKLVILAVAAVLTVGCTPSAPVTTTVAQTEGITEAPAEAAGASIILSTTTSTQDSGLLDAILPDFTAKTGIEVKVVAVGTGAALKNGEDGNCDVVLVHARSDEEAFVADGFGLERFDVMYNDFVLLGPVGDPAGLKADHQDDAAAALKALSESKTVFVSRGDDSGTHKKELEIWAEAGIEPAGEWYVEAGQGMGPVLTMANEMKAYTMTDRATYLAMKADLDLEIVVAGDEGLLNQYGVIAVNPDISENINAEGALAFVDWILSAETQSLIGEYGIEAFGEPLFFPNAIKR